MAGEASLENNSFVFCMTPKWLKCNESYKGKFKNCKYPKTVFGETKKIIVRNSVDKMIGGRRKCLYLHLPEINDYSSWTDTGSIEHVTKISAEDVDRQDLTGQLNLRSFLMMHCKIPGRVLDFNNEDWCKRKLYCNPTGQVVSYAAYGDELIEQLIDGNDRVVIISNSKPEKVFGVSIELGQSGHYVSKLTVKVREDFDKYFNYCKLSFNDGTMTVMNPM